MALATAGLDATRLNPWNPNCCHPHSNPGRVTLVADPRPDGCFSTTVELTASCGKIKLDIEHQPSADNPRTSADVAYSVVKSLKAVCSPIVVGT